MAQVPLYNNPQVNPTVLPNAQLQEAPVAQGVAATNERVGQLNRAADQLVDTTFNIGLDMQKQANALRVDDALNQAREASLDLQFGKDTGYTNLKGRDALERQSGMPLANEYGNTLNDRFGAIEQSLGNDAQRLAFRQRANDMATQFRAGVMQHEQQEFKNYAISTSDGITATRQREIGLNYNNPQLVDDAVTSIRAQAYNIAKLTGKSAEWAETQGRVAASNAHLTAIDAALQNNNPAYADAYLKKNAKDMDANDILRANGLITKQLDAQIGLAAGQKVMLQSLPQLQPTDAGRLTNLVIGAESGGKRYAAQGYGKRQDGTEKGSGFFGELKMTDGSGNVATEISVGVELDGKEVQIPTLVPTLSDKEKKYLLAGNDPTDAIVDKAVAHARGRMDKGLSPFANDGKLLTSPKGAKGEMQVLDSTNKAPGFGVRPAADATPDERARVGRDYLGAMLQRSGGNIPEALAAYNAGPGAVDAAKREASKNGNDAAWLSYLPMETRKYVTGIMQNYNSGGGAPQKPTEFDLHQEVDKLVPPQFAERNKAARQVVSQQFADLNKATKQREDEAVASAQSALIANGGRFADLPLNIRSSIPPGQYDNMLTFADNIAKEKPIATDWSLYYALKRDPQVLGQTNLMSLRNKLSNTEFKQLTEEQQNIQQGKTDQMTNLRTGKDVLNQYMREVGIDPTPKDDDKKGAAVVGRVWSAFEDRVRAQEANLGRKLKPEEIQHQAAAIFQSVEVNGLIWNSKTTAPQVEPGQAIVVPPADEKQIIDALRSAGKPVTPQNIQDLYRRKHGVVPRG